MENDLENIPSGLFEYQKFLDQAQKVVDAPVAEQLESVGVDAEEYQDFQNYQRDLYDRPIQAAALGVLRGASFGVSDAILSAAGLKEDVKKIKEFNPISGVVGEVGSFLLPSGWGGAAIKGVSKAGRVVEGALANQLGKIATKSTALNILKNAAPLAANQAIQGAAYGAGQVVSEAALGDEEMTAEKVLSTVGLSSVISGAFGGGLSVAGQGIKKAYQGLAKNSEAIKKGITGLSKETRQILLNQPEQLDEVLKAGEGVQEAIKGRIEKLAAKIDDGFDKNIAGTMEAQRPIIDRLSAIKNNTNPKASEVAAIIDNQIRKIAPDQKNIISPIIQNQIDELQSIKKAIYDVARAGSGPFAAEIPTRSLRLSAKDVYNLRTQFYQSLKSFQTDPLKRGNPLQDVYQKIYLRTNGMLSNVAPELKASNKKLSKLIGARKDLKRFGLSSYEVDPQKLYGLLGNRGDWRFIDDSLKTIDDSIGSNIRQEVKLLRAVKEIYPEDVFARSATGRSLLFPVVGAAVGTLVGGLGGGAAGAIAGQAVQSPLLQPMLLRGAVRVGDKLGSLSKSFQKLGGLQNAIVPRAIVPFITAQTVGLNNLQEKSALADSRLTRGVNSFTGDDAGDAESVEALTNTNFGGGRVNFNMGRGEAFNERADELEALVSNPDVLTELIEQNMAQIAYVAPKVAEKMTLKAMNMFGNVYNRMPKRVEVDPITMKQKRIVSDAEMARFERYVEAVENPYSVFKDLRTGKLTKEQVDAVRENYPNIFEALRVKIVERAQKKPLSYRQKEALKSLLGDLVSSRPMNRQVFQQSYAAPDVQEGLRQQDIAKMKLAMNSQTQAQRIEAR